VVHNVGDRHFPLLNHLALAQGSGKDCFCLVVPFITTESGFTIQDENWLKIL
jgi:hypothetical protein